MGQTAQLCGWLDQTDRVKTFVNYGESGQVGSKTLQNGPQSFISTQEKNCMIAKQKQ